MIPLARTAGEVQRAGAVLLPVAEVPGVAAPVLGREDAAPPFAEAELALEANLPAGCQS